MLNSIVFIAHGDLTTDKIYDYEYNILKEDGGGCNFNVLYHLANMGENCYAIGTIGDDYEGKIAINSLKRAGVNTNYVKVEDRKTSTHHIIIPNTIERNRSIIHSRYHPKTNELTVSFSDKLPVTLPDMLKNKYVFTILERMRLINLQFIKNIEKGKVCLDIGSINTINTFDKTYILEFLQNVNLLLINNSVTKSLFSILNVENLAELFQILNCDLLLTTSGSEPATFVFANDNGVQIINKKPKIIDNAIDNTGAGDAFFSVIIKAYSKYIQTNKSIDVNFVNNVFNLANAYAAEIVQLLGSRGDKKTINKWIQSYNEHYKHEENILCL